MKKIKIAEEKINGRLLGGWEREKEKGRGYGDCQDEGMKT